MTQVRRRLASVDAFRALTMLLMIFVNDLVSVKGAPSWLEHAGEAEDRMGLADLVFPAFLFIVGLSIPFAIDRRGRSDRRSDKEKLPDPGYISHSPGTGKNDGRKARGESAMGSLGHILLRSLALLVMGIYQVNYEEYSRAAGFIARYWWLVWTTAGFFLVWLDYPRTMEDWKKWVLRGGGILLLAVMAIIYKGGEPAHPIGMRTHWYGILGLIGWCYLICAVLYWWLGEKTGWLTVIMGIFLAICVIDKAHGLQFLRPVRQFIWIVGSGSLPAITMAGVIAALVYRRGVEKEEAGRSLLLLLGFGAVMLAGGFVFRPFWGISKIRATPSWVMICTAVSLAVFALLAYVCDMRGMVGWYRPISPAGTSTLTCYLLTYIHFGIAHLIGWRIPEVLRTGGIGVMKCIIYALLIAWIAGWLEKRKFRLSI